MYPEKYASGNMQQALRPKGVPTVPGQGVLKRSTLRTERMETLSHVLDMESFHQFFPLSPFHVIMPQFPYSWNEKTKKSIPFRRMWQNLHSSLPNSLEWLHILGWTENILGTIKFYITQMIVLSYVWPLQSWILLETVNFKLVLSNGFIQTAVVWNTFL